MKTWMNLKIVDPFQHAESLLAFVRKTGKRRIGVAAG
jgi:hypothetical protein